MSLSFGEPQTTIAIVYAVIVILIVITFAIIARQSRGDVPADLVKKSAYRIRSFWFAFLLLLLSTAVVVSMFFLPYSDADATETVEVTGGQFYWTLSEDKFKTGTSASFVVTSADVNHGLGVYDPDGVMIGSVQAMPGFDNDLKIDLDKAGTYTIACLEFCGINHHNMMKTFEVTD